MTRDSEASPVKHSRSEWVQFEPLYYLGESLLRTEPPSKTTTEEIGNSDTSKNGSAQDGDDENIDSNAGNTLSLTALTGLNIKGKIEYSCLWQVFSRTSEEY